MKHWLKKLLTDTCGNIALSTAIAAVPLLFAMGGATDYTLLHQQKSNLQQAVDSAALATNKEAGLTSINDTEIQAIAENYVYSGMGISAGSDAASNLTVTTTASSDQTEITVDVSYYWTPFVLHHLSTAVLPIRTSATATRAGSENVCIIALDTSSAETILMSASPSTLTANDCAIYSNSTSSKSISAVSGTAMAASTTYSGGGFNGPLVIYDPEPITDSPNIDDPLIGRAQPAAGACDYNDFLHDQSGVTVTIKPGTYCGGITTKSTAKLVLEPGIYIMKDGPLLISGNSTIEGDNVGFYFEGDKSVFLFNASTQVILTAPKTGSMSGILFFEDRNAPANREFTIKSHDAERFEGTVYLKKGRLVVDKASKVGQKSNWTAFVVNQLEIKKGPQLVINSDYSASDVPVPQGVGGNGTTTVRLSR